MGKSVGRVPVAIKRLVIGARLLVFCRKEVFGRGIFGGMWDRLGGKGFRAGGLGLGRLSLGSCRGPCRLQEYLGINYIYASSAGVVLLGMLLADLSRQSVEKEAILVKIDRFPVNGQVPPLIEAMLNNKTQTD
jgi:hypothetical protein